MWEGSLIDALDLGELDLALDEDSFVSDYGAASFMEAEPYPTEITVEGVKPYWSPNLGANHGEIFYLSKLIVEVSTAYEAYGPSVVTGYPCIAGYGIHSEVGDDHTSYTRSPVQFLMELVLSTRLLNVEVSKKDTYISQFHGNYSESFLLKPMNKSEAWLSASFQGGKDLPFLDTPKIRTLLPICAMNQKHSDTIEGKVSLNSRIHRFSTALCRTEAEVATMIQIVSLGLMRERKFPFLPDYLGGLGAIPPGAGSIQFQIAADQFKGKSYKGLIYRITQSVDKVSRGERSGLFLLSSISTIRQHWRKWYTYFSKYVPSISGQLPLEITSFQVGKLGKDPIWDYAASRANQLGGLCTETELLVHQRNRELTQQILSARTVQESKLLRDLEKDQMKSLTVFSNSFKENWGDHLEFYELPGYTSTLNDLSSVCTVLSLDKSGGRELKNAIRDDILYDPIALDKIYSTGPLKVDLGVMYQGRLLPLYLQKELSEEQRVSLERLLSWVKDPGRGKFPPRELIEDDPIIILESLAFHEESMERVGITPVLFLQSGDRKLAREINSRSSIPVVLVNPAATDEDIQELTMDLLERTNFSIEIKVLKDSGSVEHRQKSSLGSRSIYVLAEKISRLFPRKLVERTVPVSPILEVFDRGNRLPTNPGSSRPSKMVLTSVRSVLRTPFLTKR
jgi:hypothetical protein